VRFSNDFFFQWVENLWKKESIEKLKCNSYFFVNTKWGNRKNVSVRAITYFFELALVLRGAKKYF